MRELRDQYDVHDRWDLTQEEDLSAWSTTQDQTWHKTSRGWFLVTKDGSDDVSWYSVNRMYNDYGALTNIPYWFSWNGVLPYDIVSEYQIDMKGEFDLDDIELAEIFMEELS